LFSHTCAGILIMKYLEGEPDPPLKLPNVLREGSNLER
jgi:hypothetical protein